MNTPADSWVPARSERLLEGRYRVGARIARGGMSTVYRGLDLRLDRPVAIKVMDPTYATDPSFLARFEREARLAATVHHPGIVQVFDQGRDSSGDDDVVYLVMELVDGGTLRDLLRTGPLGLSVALSVLDPLLGALGAAHHAGLVHRDVKPENVLISGRGEVKVADFGLVRAAGTATLATGDVILGTVAYLSPEQVATGASDPRSDVYAAGIVAWEMLTGHPPYSGDNPIGVAYQHVHSDVPPVGDVDPDVPVEVEDLLLAATRRDPAQRPHDAAEFRSALQSVRDRLGLPSVPVPTPVRAPAPTQATQTRTVAPAGPGGTRVVPGGGATAGMPGDRTTEVVAVRRRVHRWRRWLIAILVLLLLGVAAAVGGWWLGSGRWSTMPKTVGLSQSQAETVVRDAGLVPAVSTAPDDTVRTGQVSASDPIAGTRQLRGNQVQLVVSTGRPTVPRIDAGTSVAAAQTALRDAHLTPVTGAQVYDATTPVGAVVRTDPAAGTSLALNARVTLLISKGPQPVTVPDVTGKQPQDAENALVAAGLTVGPERTSFDADVDKGTVVGTDPPAGSTATAGTQVSVLVADSLTVPAVAGSSQDQATAALQEAGFTVTVGDPVFDPNVDGGLTSATEPAAGTRVDPAQPAVTLHLSNAVTVPSVTGRSLSDAENDLTAAGLPYYVSSLTGASFGRVIATSPDGGTRVEPGTTVVLSSVP